MPAAYAGRLFVAMREWDAMAKEAQKKEIERMRP
jgi:hypothetical protein